MLMWAVRVAGVEVNVARGRGMLCCLRGKGLDDII